ncbi:globin [Halomonas getboli]|uniref:globin n=1 Tax=Halomonas getboli TaxID=2935862 RepID=UPI001FFF81AE|nr:globin [Halomonas getboli]MCK2185151.1 globin [Halomonas getboli]
MDIVKVFDASYARVMAHEVEGRGFFEAFYRRFQEGSTEVAGKFRGIDMDRQQAMLKKSFYHLLSLYAASHDGDYLARVAIRHGRGHLDIRPALYDRWLETMMVTLREYDPECGDEQELAWRLVMAPGIAYMKFHYDRETPVGDAQVESDACGG